MPGAFEIVMDERKVLVDKIIGILSRARTASASSSRTAHERMKQGYFFNKEEWDRASLRPQNPLSKVQYKEGNRLRLMAMVVEHGYTDPRWATARQYSEKGYFIKKGEHGVLCEKWIFEKQKKVKDQNGNVTFETVQLERPQISFFRVFNAEQVQDFPSFSRVWREFFNLELHTGMRRGELCGLRWCDVDFEKKTVSVRQVISRLGNGKGVIVKEPKTKSSIRTIAVSKDVIESLRSWRREQMQTCMQMGNYWEGQRGEMFDQNFVFTRPDLSGRPIYPDSVSHKFHEIIQAYNEEYHGNIPDINFHGTRHTSATLLISEGLDVVEVSHRLGHSKTSTTEDIYAHQLEKVDEHAADVLDSILNKSR